MAVDFVKSTTAEAIDVRSSLLSQKIGVFLSKTSATLAACTRQSRTVPHRWRSRLASRRWAPVQGDGLALRMTKTREHPEPFRNRRDTRLRDAKRATCARPWPDPRRHRRLVFAGLEDGAEKTALAMLLFGRSGKDTDPAAESGGARGLRGDAGRGQGAGPPDLDEKTAKAAERFHREPHPGMDAAASQGLSQTLRLGTTAVPEPHYGRVG
jgi:hypothetical protein